MKGKAACREEKGDAKVKREIVVNVMSAEKRAAVVEDGRLVELFIERANAERVVGNIYKGRVENVLPGMQAAFVNIGLERNAFLYVDDAVASLDFPDLDEEITAEEEPAEEPGKERVDRRRLTISDLLTVGQDIVVQITKEPIGTKGARVVTNLTIPGRYLVLMPTVSYAGVSRRIEDSAERDRLRQIASKIKPPNMGVIVRTVAEGRGERELQQDMKFLLKVWERLQQKAARVKAPAVLYKDYDLIYRLVRDALNEEIDRFVIDSKPEFERAREILTTFGPKLRRRVVLHEEKQPSFEFYGIEPQIEKALKRKVWLDCGGYLVIDETEALVSIDVNTGKFIGTTNLADTVLKTNLDAAREIARQLRLRNMAGIIVIDFIDMDSAEHRNKVQRLLEEEVRKDRVKTNIVGWTSLGLMEVTRKKVKRDLDQVLLKRCSYCDGIGKTLSEETVAIGVERQLHSLDPAVEAVLVTAHPSVAAVLIGAGGANLRRIEEELGKTVYIRGVQSFHVTETQVFPGKREEVEQRALPVRVGQRLEIMVEEPHVTNPRDGIARIEGYVVDLEEAGHLVGRRVRAEVTKVFRTYAKARLLKEEAGEGVEETPAPPVPSLPPLRQPARAAERGEPAERSESPVPPVRVEPPARPPQAGKPGKAPRAEQAPPPAVDQAQRPAAAPEPGEPAAGVSADASLEEPAATSEVAEGPKRSRSSRRRRRRRGRDRGGDGPKARSALAETAPPAGDAD
ncbi:MAG: Rne/Rng family ribonuclease [Chitinophagales bacterium]